MSEMLNDGYVVYPVLCRAQSFAERLRLGIAVIHGEAQDAESDLVDGRHSPPTVKNIGAIHPSLEIPCKHLRAPLHVLSNLHMFSHLKCTNDYYCMVINVNYFIKQYSSQKKSLQLLSWETWEVGSLSLW